MRDWFKPNSSLKLLEEAKALVAEGKVRHEQNMRFFAALRLRSEVLDAREAELNQRAQLLAASAAQMNAAVTAIRNSLIEPSDKPTLQ